MAYDPADPIVPFYPSATAGTARRRPAKRTRAQQLRRDMVGLGVPGATAPPRLTAGHLRLLELGDLLLKLRPRQWDYTHLVAETDARQRCGTVCCAAGWLPAVFPRSWVWVGGGEVGRLSVANRRHQSIHEWFGITYEVSTALFFRLQHLLKRPGVWVHMHDVTPRHWVYAARVLVATGALPGSMPRRVRRLPADPRRR